MNRIKRGGSEGLALQITKPARSAGLVEENDDGEATRLANVRVYAFDDLLLVVDIDRVDIVHIAELVTSATEDTESIYQAIDASVQISGHGYQVQLPPAQDAGFKKDDRTGTHPANGIIVISKGSSDDGSAGDAARLGKDLVTIRQAQIE